MDYLGKGVRSLKGGVKPRWVKKAYQWVIQEHEKYIKSKNYELAGRFISHLNYWNPGSLFGA